MSKPAASLYTEIRPWGSFTILEQGENYKVKRLIVNPGQRFSLQYHHQRSEHWVIVSGKANVTCNQEQLTLTPSQSLFLPIGTVHRLENHQREPLVVIEVQYGEYLGEDDIVRLADDYHRVA